MNSIKNSIYDYDDYRAYLRAIIAQKDGKSRGFRSFLADQIGCQRSFISQVLNEDSHFNLENGNAIGKVLGLSSEEIDFFLLLISYARAGTHELRVRFRNQIRSTRETRMILKNRFKESDTLSVEDKVEYYSSWLYGAIRVLITIPQFQYQEEIEKYLKVPSYQISKVIEFLNSRNLIHIERGKITPTEKHLYLGNDSKLISKHHINWRIKAIEALDRESQVDLHFSAVNSLSRNDVLKIREKLAITIEEIRNTVKDSNEECLYTLCVDLFETF